MHIIEQTIKVIKNKKKMDSILKKIFDVCNFCSHVHHVLLKDHTHLQGKMVDPIELLEL